MTSTTSKITLYAAAGIANRSGAGRGTQILPPNLHVDLKSVDDVHRGSSPAMLGVGEGRCLEFRYLHGAVREYK